MGFIFFVTTIVFLILWLTKDNTKSSSGDSGYAQGYWDGYRALGKKIRHELAAHKPDMSVIKRHVDIGFGSTGDVVYTEPDQTETETEYSAVSDQAPALAAETTPQAVQPVAPVLAPVSYPYQPVVVHQPTKEEREARSLRNLNTLLFVGSVLLVAAAAAFIATAMPDTVKLVGVWLVVLGFYLTGMLLLRSTRVRPAAIAFLGTGLGILPFAGVAVAQYTSIGGPAAWALTSLIGIVAYFFAALKLNSQVVSYLTLAFVISLAASSSDALSVPLVFSFVAIILVSLGFSVLAFLKPTWLPTIFAEPIDKTGQIVTPVTLAASIILVNRLSLPSYEIVFGVATLHYMVAWLQSKRMVFETAVRMLAHITVLLVGFDMVDGTATTLKDFGVIWLLTSTVHVGLSLFLRARANMGAIRRETETAWYGVLTFAQVIAPVFWLRNEHAPELTSLTFFLVGLGSLLLTLVTRRVGAAVIGLLSSLVLPLVLLGGVFELDRTWQIAWYIVAAAASYAGYFYLLRIRRSSAGNRLFMVAAYLSYWLLALLLAISEGGWMLTGLLFAGIVLFTATSYSERSPGIIVLTWLFVWLYVTRLWWHADPGSPWVMLGGLLITAVLAHLISFVHLWRRDQTRRGILIGVMVTMLTLGIPFAFTVEHGFRALGLVWLSLATLQIAYSYVVLWRTAGLDRLRSSEPGWQVGMMALQAVTVFFWMGDNFQAELTVLSLGLVAVGGLLTTYLARRVGYAYITLGTSLILLPTLLQGVFDLPDTYLLTSGFVGLGVAALAGRAQLAGRRPSIRSFLTAAYVVYYLAALLSSVVDSSLSTAFQAAIVLIGTAFFYTASYVERSGSVAIVSWLLLPFGIAQFLPGDITNDWTTIYTLTITAVAAYVAYALHHSVADGSRRDVSLAATWVALGLALIVSLAATDAEYWTAWIIVVGSLTVAIEGLRRNATSMVETAVYGVTFGLQRVVDLMFPELNFVFFAHWWAVTLVATAYWRKQSTARLVIAASFVTLGTGLYALFNGGWYQLFFLVEHTALLVAGALASKRWAIWWGLVATVVAVLYFLRDITFLAFAFLGLVLIGIVVWRLIRISQK